jgi:NADP-dependent aldehyde dehydrogenase
MLHPQIHRNFEERKKEVLSIPGVHSFSCAIAAKGIEGTWCLAETTLQDFASNSSLQEEVFGPFALLVYYQDVAALNQVLESLPGQLTGSVFFREHDSQIDEWTELLCAKVGRIILNGVPTGVRVVETMHHGGPFPASSDVRFTAVGQDSINRFQKDVSIQSQNIT